MPNAPIMKTDKIRLTKEQTLQLQKGINRKRKEAKIPMAPKVQRNRDLIGIPHDKNFESDAMKQLFGGSLESRNGLTPEMVKTAMDKRKQRQLVIKDALGMVDLLLRN